jgi:hypothetical protein
MFFSDGGSDVREVQQYLNPEAEHYLDWFHLTMQIAVMRQYAKGLETTSERRDEGLKLLESVKHYLWHRNVVRARDKLEELHDFLDQEGIAGENGPKLRKALEEFDTYKRSLPKTHRPRFDKVERTRRESCQRCGGARPVSAREKPPLWQRLCQGED